MISNWKHIILKLICILLFIFIYYKITDSNWFNSNNTNVKSQIEEFEDSIENEKIHYIKLKETYIDPSDKTLDLLYANYFGEETGHDVWENKTLDQCTDICSNIKGCVGFSRDLKLDTEPASCYPNNIINKCYSNRKGNITQMQNAIKFNTFVKSNVKNVLNTCIGDKELTLDRTVFIKSYAMPNSCIGVSDDIRVILVDNSTQKFKSACNFRIKSGLDGIGTVSFLHIDTGKYLYRNPNNNLILYDTSSGQTENNQRASFNLYDSNIGSGSIMFKAMTIEGETTDKFITLDDKYLTIKVLPTDIIQKNSTNNFTFYIIDSIVNNNIITDKENMPMITKPMFTSPMITDPMSMNIMKDDTDIRESFVVNLDKTSNIPLYNNLFAKPTDFILTDYLEDNYNKPDSALLTTITNKYNDILLKNQLSTSLNKNQDEYNSIKNLNLEIEKEIANLNLGLNGKNDKLINELDKMRITDMSNDYFFLKNLNKNQQIGINK